MTESQSEPQTDGGTTVTTTTVTDPESESATASGLRTRVALATRQVGSLAATEMRLRAPPALGHHPDRAVRRVRGCWC